MLRAPLPLGLLAVLPLMAFASPARAQPACDIPARALSMEEVEVRPPGRPPFQLGLVRASTVVHTGVEEATVHVLGAVELDAHVPMHRLPPRLARTERIAGVLRVPAGARAFLPAEGGVDVELALGLTARTHLTCESLAVTGRLLSPGPLPDRAPGRLLHPVADDLSVRASPEGETALHLRAAEPEHLLLVAGETRGEMVHVTARWPTGAALDAWVRSADVAPAERPDLAVMGGMGQGIGCGSGVAPRIFTGQGRLPPGTALLDAPGGAPWARVTRALTVRVAIEEARPEWVRILRLPSVKPDACRELDHAWVPIDVVTLPSFRRSPLQPSSPPGRGPG